MKLFALAAASSLAATVLSLAACSSSASSSPSSSEPEPAPAHVDVIQSAVGRNRAPTLTQDEKDTLAKGQANFAVDMLKEVWQSKTDSNVFLSPTSISLALAMTYGGAQGDTAAEMKKSLHFNLPSDRVATGFDYLDLQLESRGANVTPSDDTNRKPFRLNIANSIWSQKGFSFLPSFIDSLSVNYGASLNEVDFANEGEPSRIAINKWVESKTEDRIKDLLPKESITADTKMVLVNAVYFNAAWMAKFDPNLTHPQSFTKLDGSRTDVQMMNSAASTPLPYSLTDDYEAALLPYDGNEISMLVIMPKEGTFAAFESALTGDKVLDVLAKLQPDTAVQLSMPKLKLNQTFDLKAHLTNLGMKLAFDPVQADFSGMIGSKGLSISAVVHQTFLDVNEGGTEASAATAVVMSSSGGAFPPPNDKVMIVNHPFITAIVDNQTKTLIFVGNIVEPSL